MQVGYQASIPVIVSNGTVNAIDIVAQDGITTSSYKVTVSQ
ncbi:MAG: hypothetical protein Q8M76_11460 [Spirochaetaceae bacterium]|nr:hypothetical protein [Spirochaetaceae bacterium]